MSLFQIDMNGIVLLVECGSGPDGAPGMVPPLDRQFNCHLAAQVRVIAESLFKIAEHQVSPAVRSSPGHEIYGLIRMADECKLPELASNAFAAEAAST